MPIAFRVDGQRISIQDCEKMSDQELFRLLEENLPALADTVRTVNGANRETVMAFLRFVSNWTE